jgi:hypothetical protein
LTRFLLILSWCLSATVCAAEESAAEKAILAELHSQYCGPHDNAERFIGATAAASRIAVAAGLGARAVKIATECVKK